VKRRNSTLASLPGDHLSLTRAPCSKFGGHSARRALTVQFPPQARTLTERGKPKTIRVDNEPEFAGRLLDQWAYLNGVGLDFSRPGTPTDNAFIEAFNARIRAECLNASWFLFLGDARERIEAWRIDYNTERLHSALGHLTPRAFARQALTA
jgi:transposase InsO family protein